MALEKGVKLGPYEIIEAAGAGGMGEVYKANDTRLDRIVAIKVLPESMSMNQDIKARFEREAKAISSLKHPNICVLHDIGNENGIDYLVMEFLEGETLAERMSKGGMDSKEVLEIAGEISDALDKAHRQGLIHRDLKPGNVMLTKEGAKLMDFGLAKMQMGEGLGGGLTQITSTTPLTGAGTILGTLHYMSPEQLDGTEADARSDIFAFGVMLYEMLTGQKAFDGKSQAGLIAAIIEREPPPISQIKPMTPPGLDRLVKKCIAKDPESRWQSVRDLSDEIRWISQSGSMAGVPMTVTAKRKFKFKMAQLNAIVAMLVAVVAIYLYWGEISKEKEVIRTKVLPQEFAEFSDFAGGSFAFSPDGKKLAYTAADTANGDVTIWVRQLNSLAAIPLPGTKDAYFPFWSTDSKYIGFFSDTKMKKILSTGGPALTICDALQGRNGSWNKDDIIIFAPDYNSVIHKVSAAGGESVPITSFDTSFQDYSHRWVEFLPDGDHYLFFARTKGGSGSEKDAICFSSLSDTSITRLFNAKSNVQYANGQILFMREDVLMAQPFDDGSLELTGDAVPIAEDVSFMKGWSRGVFTASENGHLLYRIGTIVTGSQLVIHDETGLAVDSLDDQQVMQGFEMSDDESKIAFDIEDEGSSENDVWIYDLNRRIKTRFTFGPSSSLLPVWSPDGEEIAYSSDNPEKSGINIKNTFGVDIAKVLISFEGEGAVWDWSGDGKILVYGVMSPDTKADIFLHSFEGDDIDSIYLQTEFFEWNPRVSPDNRWLAYTSEESGKNEIYVSTFPKFQRKWQVSIKGGFHPRWNDDGTILYYFDADDMLHKVEVDGSGSTFQVGKATPLFKINSTGLSGYHVLDNGRRFIVNEVPEYNSISQCVHVYNWHEELKE